MLGCVGDVLDEGREGGVMDVLMEFPNAEEARMGVRKRAGFTKCVGRGRGTRAGPEHK